METKSVHIEQVTLVAPVQCHIPFLYLKDFPDSCGPGRGLGEILVPDSIFGLKISPACWIHDRSWVLAAPTWNDFHQTNYMLERNMQSIIIGRSKFTFLKYARLYRPVTYFIAVDTIGIEHFWKLKKKQMQAGQWFGYILPEGV